MQFRGISPALSGWPFRPSLTDQSGRGVLAFLRRRPDNRVMQMVGRRVLATAFSLALLALLFVDGGGRAATDPTATVVVLTSGIVPEAGVLGSRDYGYADYGLVLRNRSLARDAINVTVEVEAV